MSFELFYKEGVSFMIVLVSVFCLGVSCMVILSVFVCNSTTTKIY